MRISFNNIQNTFKGYEPKGPKLTMGPLTDTFLRQASEENYRKRDYEIPEGYTKEEFYSSLLNHVILTFLKDKVPPGGKDIPISKLFENTFRNDFEDYIIRKFQNNGIKTYGDFKRFLDIISKTDKTYEGSYYKFIDIFGKLKDPEDIKNFTETVIISSIVSNISNGEININTYTDFIKHTGIKNEDRFYKAFANQKNKFHNLDTSYDMYCFLEHIKESYDEKFEGFKKAIDPKSHKKDKDLRNLYLKNHEIIDYLYEKDYKGWESKFAKIYKAASDESKLSDNTRKVIAESSFQDIFDMENKINFFEYLDRKNISIQELNGYTKGFVVSDIHIEDILQNKEQIISAIIDKGLSYNDALKFYTSHKDILNSCVNKDSKFASQDSIESCLDFIKNFAIKDDKAFVNFYNNITGSNTETLTKEKVYKTINLMDYTNKEHLAKYRKNKNYNLIKEATLQKETFETLPFEYQTYVSPESITALSIFKNSKTIDEAKINIRNRIYQISKEEEGVFQKLLKYFNTPEEAKNFINRNINLSGIKDYQDFSSKCLFITDSLYEAYGLDYVKKLDEKEIIKNSKQDMKRIFDNFKTKEKMSTFFKVLIDKKINSAGELLDFLEKYQDENGDFNNVLEHFSNAPEGLNIKKYNFAISKIENTLKENNLNFRVNNQNIKNLSYMSIIRYDKSIKDKNIGYFAEILSTHKNGGNFITDLNQTFERKPVLWRKWQIASEMAKYLDDYKDSYSNLFSLLKIDRKEQNKNNEQNIKNIEKRIPNVILDILNSPKWTTFNGKPLNIGLHARLRLIERYVLDENSSAETIDRNKSIEKLKNIINTIYGQTPIFVSSNEDDRDAFYCIYKEKESRIERTKAIFGKNGKLITVIPAQW